MTLAHSSLTLLNHDGEIICSFQTRAPQLSNPNSCRRSETCASHQTKTKSARPAELRALIDHKLLYIHAYVASLCIVFACEQLWYVYCAPDWSVCGPVMSLCLLEPVCVGSSSRDRPAERTCSRYVNMRPVCMYAFIYLTRLKLP